MAIFRINKTKDYTIMSNNHLKEKDLSLKAKGLLSLMLSLSDNWNYSIDGLIAICKENRTSIRSALQELKDFGYIQVTKIPPCKETKGRFKYIYDVFETKIDKEKCSKTQPKQDTDFQHLEIQHLENRYLNKYTKELNTKDKIKQKEKYIKEITERDLEISDYDWLKGE